MEPMEVNWVINWTISSCSSIPLVTPKDGVQMLCQIEGLKSFIFFIKCFISPALKIYILLSSKILFD